MRHASMYALLAGVVATIALLGAPASAGTSVAGLAYSPLASQDRSGFGEAIVFVPSGYTPKGIASLAYAPLASQDRSGFGESIAYRPSAYTPPGIVSFVYSPLASQSRSGFGEPIAFAPSGYTPPGTTSLYPIDVAATR